MGAEMVMVMGEGPEGGEHMIWQKYRISDIYMWVSGGNKDM